MPTDKKERAGNPEVQPVLVHKYVRLWPREVFYIRDSQKKLKDSLKDSGVYILYLDFDVFYIGKADNLYQRLHTHATKRYRLWNHFSAFLVHPNHLAEVEAIMIAATPRTANKSGGKVFKKIDLPPEIRKALDQDREIETSGKATGNGISALRMIR